MKSIISNKKNCYICGSHRNIEFHHIYGGTGNRKISDENGFTVYLCHTCHQEVTEHKNWKDNYLKVLCQTTYEADHSRDEFMALIGRNYRED